MVQDPPGTASTENPGEDKTRPIGFPVSPMKFWIMCIGTNFFYPLYWGFRNFRSLLSPRLNIAIPIVCAILLPVSFYAIVSKLKSTALQYNIVVNLKWPMAVGFFALRAMLHMMTHARLPLEAFIVGTFSIIPLFLVQQKVNEVNAKLRPDIQPDSKFSLWDKAGIVVLGLLMLIGIVKEIIYKFH